ncbi:MAG: glycosyltransferase [Pseudomonadota bacterium]
MAAKLNLYQRSRINALVRDHKFVALNRYLQKLSDKNVDVAGVPFHALDHVLSSSTEVDLAEMAPLAHHTLEGQPRLFWAILRDLKAGAQDNLDEIALDDHAHPMTRFEAMGWAVFCANRAVFPAEGTQVTDVFQYWDQPEPPSQIKAARQKWVSAAHAHSWYDDAAAQEYIYAAFGPAAAREFDAFWHPALKSDVFRLYRLIKDGGIYCDADSLPEAEAAQFQSVGGSFLWASSLTHVPNCVVFNGWLAAPPQNVIIARLLSHVLQNIRDLEGAGIFWLSGPGAYTTFMYRHRHSVDLKLLPQGTLKAKVFRQFSAPYKETERNWRVYEHNRGLNNEAGVQNALQSALAAA